MGFQLLGIDKGLGLGGGGGGTYWPCGCPANGYMLNASNDPGVDPPRPPPGFFLLVPPLAPPVPPNASPSASPEVSRQEYGKVLRFISLRNWISAKISDNFVWGYTTKPFLNASGMTLFPKYDFISSMIAQHICLQYAGVNASVAWATVSSVKTSYKCMRFLYKRFFSP